MKDKNSVSIGKVIGSVIAAIVAIIILFAIEYLAVSGIYALVCMAVESLEFSWFDSLVITLVMSALSGFFRPKTAQSK